MASKTSVELIDDIDGSPADESVVFALDNVSYTIDLSRHNAAELRERLEPFITNGSRVKAVRTAPARRAVTAAPGLSRAQNQAIRDWARGQGEKVNERGRIPAELVTRFQEAHAAAESIDA